MLTHLPASPSGPAERIVALHCQVETEHGTCRGEAYSECRDCLKRLCDEHVAAHVGIFELCAECLSALPQFESAVILPTIPVYEEPNEVIA